MKWKWNHACSCESFQLFENIMEYLLFLQLLKIFMCMPPHWNVFINCGTKFCPSYIEMNVMCLSVYNLTELSIQLCNISHRRKNECGILVEWYWQGKNGVQREKLFKFYFIITNPIWTALGSNPGLCDERPVTNHLSHGNITYTYNTFTLLPLQLLLLLLL